MLLLLLLFGATWAVPECPRYSEPFDYQSCDPEKRSQCPGGFTCRRGNDTNNPSKNIYLCCDDSLMTVGDWFSEANLIPQVFPQGPQTKLKSIQLAPVEQGADIPLIHIGDEVVVLSYPNYVTSMLERVTFTTSPMFGKYLHFMTIVGWYDEFLEELLDPGYRPTAIFLNYNQPSTGAATMLTMAPGMNPQMIAYVDNSTTIPVRDSYRALYVILVFETEIPITIEKANTFMINNPTNGTAVPTLTQALMGSCTDVTCLLSNTTLGISLRQPIAGTLFHLTTLRSLFDTKGQQQQNPSISLPVLTSLGIMLARYL